MRALAFLGQAVPAELAQAPRPGPITLQLTADTLDLAELESLLPAGDARRMLVQLLWGFALHAVDELQLNDADLPEDATVTTYTGSHSLVFSGASSSPGGNAPTVANSSGSAIAFGAGDAAFPGGGWIGAISAG